MLTPLKFDENIFQRISNIFKTCFHNFIIKSHSFLRAWNSHDLTSAVAAVVFKCVMGRREAWKMARLWLYIPQIPCPFCVSIFGQDNGWRAKRAESKQTRARNLASASLSWVPKLVFIACLFVARSRFADFVALGRHKGKGTTLADAVHCPAPVT